jgi:starch-binding outer membrane protein, SusD/RagB family
MNKRNRNRLLYGIAGVMVAAGVTYACSDFLNVPSQGTLDQSTLATHAGVEGLLIATYRALDCSSSSAGSWGCAASNWVWGSVGSGDAVKGSNLGDQQPINDIETFNWSVGTADTYLNQKWSQAYDGVARANATLRLLAQVQASTPGAISAADAAGIQGEAIFLRAHYHFEAYRMWQNIPYYRETDTDFRKTNAGVNAIAEIIADLNQAIPLLKTGSGGNAAKPRNGDKGRITSWGATAYLGRVQVYGAAATPALWDAAQTTLRSVYTGGPFSLETSFDHVWTGFTSLQDGPETILAFQASVRDGEPSGWNSNWGERLNFPHSGSHFGCCGFHQPSYNLVNFYAVDAAGLPLAFSGAAWNNLDTSFTGGGIDTLRAVDPRLDWTVGRDKVPYKDWGLHNRSWIRDASYSGPYSPKKNAQESAANAENNVGWQTTQTNDVHIHIFRYADMLLLLAEADVEASTPNLVEANTIVNLIRARAGKTAQGCGSADATLIATYPACVGNTAMTMALLPNAGGTLDSLKTPWAFYKIGLYPPFPDAATARRAVRMERRLELAMEGQHFFDLRRWGGSDTTIANYIAVEKARIPYLTLVAPYTLPKYSRYPIPSLQIDLSTVGGVSKLVQNPGW